MADFFIGVDGGGTRTRALITNERGREVGRAEGPPSLADPGRPEVAAGVIAEVARTACEQAGAPVPAAALYAGVAGTGRETTRSGVELALQREGVARRVRVGTDVSVTFADAFEDGPGILVLAGTGSIAWGRAEDGHEARVGGWGSIIGDEGSGYGIGREALRRVARDADGRGPDTELSAAILSRLGLDSLDELVGWSHEASKADIAGLVPVVVEQSRKGDAVAGEILVRAVEELEGHVLTLLQTLGPWGQAPRVALAGGLLEPGRALREPLRKVLFQHHLKQVDHQPVAVRGAVKLARGLVD